MVFDFHARTRPSAKRWAPLLAPVLGALSLGCSESANKPVNLPVRLSTVYPIGRDGNVSATAYVNRQRGMVVITIKSEERTKWMARAPFDLRVTLRDSRGVELEEFLSECYIWSETTGGNFSRIARVKEVPPEAPISLQVTDRDLPYVQELDVQLRVLSDLRWCN